MGLTTHLPEPIHGFSSLRAIISIAIIRTAVTVVLVEVFHLGLSGVWLGVLADQLSRFTLMSLRFKQGKWVDLRI